MGYAFWDSIRRNGTSPPWQQSWPGELDSYRQQLKYFNMVVVIATVGVLLAGVYVCV